MSLNRMASTGIVKFVLVIHFSVVKIKIRNFLEIFEVSEIFQLVSCYLKVDNIDVAANEKYNKVEVTLDNSDPEKTSINYHSELTSDKALQRAKVYLKINKQFAFIELLFHR